MGLSLGLIRQRSGAYGDSRRTVLFPVADVCGLRRILAHKLGKRVGDESEAAITSCAARRSTSRRTTSRIARPAPGRWR